MPDGEDKGLPALSDTQNRMRPAEEKDSHVFLFTDEDFIHIKNLIYRIAGISLAPSKKDLVYSRLARRLRARQMDTFSAYIELLESGETREHEEFINALTTNMTSFFREKHHFPILAEYLRTFPESTPINIWTCASSTGEEPYSIAMTVVEHFNTFNVPVRILATDIDTKVLDKARIGVYTLDQVQAISSDRRKRFFLKGSGNNTGLVRIRPELQRLITFNRFNLLEQQWEMREKFDVIFCRNVMIYFDRQTQQSILNKFAHCLKPDGIFFAGHSESFHHASNLFRNTGKTVYKLKH